MQQHHILNFVNFATVHRKKNITKVYNIGDNRLDILRGINLTVEEGEFVAILIITIPFIFLTKGLIMYPFWTLCHIRAQKIIVKKRTAENVNQCAIELLKRLEYSDRDKE